ncbi:hypothetical protein PVAND_000968 [Polypedilum vanderplanki]|uniref:Uncharacterized protein n=1 Tax=Polypedilum vanderplanki TaxID=319348 RepID=A0A9J6BLI4_POLVA|nr:hypothetical protein PVAND_000968 [Polypedilum vanderplanki]
MNSPPPNSNGLTPVTFPPKNLGANTISSALNAHAGSGLNGNVPSNISGPKPFSYTQQSSAISQPPMAGPKSPSSYPPPAQPTWTPSSAAAPFSTSAPKPVGPVQGVY